MDVKLTARQEYKIERFQIPVAPSEEGEKVAAILAKFPKGSRKKSKFIRAAIIHYNEAIRDMAGKDNQA